MLRLVPLLFVVGVLVAAPVPPSARTEFGTNGLLSRADLETVRFDSRAVKADSKEFTARKFDIAVHMPRTVFREGTPIPVYFVLRNNTKKPLGLDARLDLHVPEPRVVNSCDINIRDAKTGEAVYVIGQKMWSCGHGPVLEVPASGFYCAKGDLGPTAHGTPLPEGEYEVDWNCMGVRSAPVKITVTKAEAKPEPVARKRALRFFHVGAEERHELIPEAIGRPVQWRALELMLIDAAEMAASLGVGHEGVFVPDIRTIPAADKLVEAWMEWKPYRDADRVVVTLRAAPPHKQVQFERMPELHLQVEGSRSDDVQLGASERAAEKQFNPATLVTPLTIEVRLPADWRETSGLRGSAKVSVLVTAKELQFPNGRLQQLLEMAKKEPPGEDTLPVWRGVSRTEPVEVQFPSPTP